MIIGMPVYDGVDLLDVAGPHEILKWMPKDAAGSAIDVQIVAQEVGCVTTRDGFTFMAKRSFADVQALDVLWVPGGEPQALKRLMTEEKQTYLNFLRRVAATATYVCSVCEGALLLAKAGLLDGFQATTHWAFIPCLKQFKAVNVVEGTPRFVVDDSRAPNEAIRVTGGGISSGLDESLKLVELLSSYAVAQDVQQNTQYYPCPPVSSTITVPTDCFMGQVS
ncbi:MAG: DJ/PfpI family protein [Microvirga sp.]|jgi:cyclohexyl-isocyanide hydratase|nr:DJ/PfpI family protein [Microvirga sp.]